MRRVPSRRSSAISIKTWSGLPRRVRQWEAFRQQAEKLLRILDAAASLNDPAALQSNLRRLRLSIGRYGAAAGKVFWDVAGILDGRSERLRPGSGAPAQRKGNRPNPNPAAPASRSASPSSAPRPTRTNFMKLLERVLPPPASFLALPTGNLQLPLPALLLSIP